jgi:hypothetical protein
MFIYNITTQVSWNIHDQWKQWMQQTHLPAVIATGCFEKYQMVRLLEVDETEGPTYAIQFYILSKAQYNRFTQIHAPAINKESADKWGNDFVTFSTLMQIV